MGKQSIRDILEQELNKRSYITEKSISVDDLFRTTGISEWTKSIFSVQKMDTLGRRIDTAQPVRLLHAVSTYLLGIAVREGMGLSFASLPRIFSVSSIGDAFYFFWSGICLCHDLGTAYESIKDLTEREKMLSCVGRKQLLGIEYDLLSLKEEEYPKELTPDEKAWVTQTLALSNHYNCYRLQGAEEKRRKIDHGIAGAAILYDALKQEAKNGAFGRASSGELAVNAGHSRFDACCLLMACTIARHNMWTVSKPDDIACYQKFHLHSLCKGPTLELVRAEKAEEQMLFMLDFMDTIDPVKNLYVRAAEQPSPDLKELKERLSFLLDRISISFHWEQELDYRWAELLPHHQMVIHAMCSTPNETNYFLEYQSRLRGLSDWLATKEPLFDSSSPGRHKILCYYPRQRYREPSWPGGITSKEIDSICLYAGSCVPGKSGRFYQLPYAYQTLNLLMMEGLEGEKVRICEENQKPDGVYIREWRRTLEVFTDIFHAQCRYYHYAAKNMIQGYRVDRALNVNMMRNRNGTFAFTSISKERYLEELAEGKKDLVLLRITADGKFPYVDFTDVLRGNYVHAKEAEILLPPFLTAEVSGTVSYVTAAELNLRGVDGDTQIPQYEVRFGNFSCKDNPEDPYILIQKLERDKETAARVLEDICKQHKTDSLATADARCYINWKKNFYSLVQTCFYRIWEDSQLANKSLPSDTSTP